jgi:hypothetical protein
LIGPNLGVTEKEMGKLELRWDINARQNSADWPRSNSHKNDRPSLTVPGTSRGHPSRLLAPPLSAGYEETSMDDKISGLLGLTSPNSVETSEVVLVGQVR